MALYKRSIDFLPRLTKAEEEEQYKISTTGVYAALLPLLAAVIWVVAVGVSGYFKSQIRGAESTITEKEVEIESYREVREKQTELVLKIDALSDLIKKDFYPQKFFEEVSKTIQSTGDAQAEVYAYGREEEGTFNIKGKANSYLDLAKIMVVFNSREDFGGVVIDSIRYDRDNDYVNFEISFNYSEATI